MRRKAIEGNVQIALQIYGYAYTNHEKNGRGDIFDSHGRAHMWKEKAVWKYIWKLCSEYVDFKIQDKR